MKLLKQTSLLVFFLTVILACTKEPAEETSVWYFRNFQRLEQNPILESSDTSSFYCPVRKDTILWEYKDVFNPAAILHENKVYLLYRAEDTVGRYNGTSRIGIAESVDGINFTRSGKPVLYPDNDFMRRYEWEGGVEDPRVVKTSEGNYIMTYTSYDGTTARLCVAVSSDLYNWEKKGLAFKQRRFRDTWSKSGSVISRFENGNWVAEQINDKYWMYWGDTRMYLAYSDNLTDWTPLTNESGDLIYSFGPRSEYFDSRLVEPGPPAMITDHGILLLYNGMNLDSLGRDESLSPGTYSVGQALMSLENPVQLIDRSSNYLLTPQEDFEISGQIGNVCFVEGLVMLNNRYYLYYGTADSRIGVAISNDNIGL